MGDSKKISIPYHVQHFGILSKRGLPPMSSTEGEGGNTVWISSHCKGLNFRGGGRS